MTESNKYISISDEQISNDLSTPDNLLIVGDCRRGKSKLINRILAYLNAQTDYIYCFIDGDSMANHTGGNSYGHIEALRLDVDNLESFLSHNKPTLQNTAINFPYPYYTNYPDNFLSEGLY